MNSPLLIRAAELLEDHAGELRHSCTLSTGEWNDGDEADRRAHADHDEMVEIAQRLRAKEKDDLTFANNLSQALNSGDGSYRP